MRLLYIFPHPDDESFGPAAAIHSQVKGGHEVYLLTLTRGGATRQRLKLGLSVREMGEVRYREMLKVEKVLGLAGMEVADFADSGLKELDPRLLEEAVETHIEKIKPAIVVTYPVHGISGFHDHLVTHAVVKRVFVEMKDRGAGYLERLAFFTLPDNEAPVFDRGKIRLKQTEKELIDGIIQLEDEDIEALKAALGCYETYQDTIAQSGVIRQIGRKLYFEFFNENFSPPLGSLTDKIG